MNSAALPTVADSSKQADVLRQQRERQFPDDAALRVGEAVELVHDHGGDAREVEPVRVQQAIEQDLGDDDEDAGVRIDLAVAGDQADVVAGEAPPHGGRLHLLELLLGQGDQRGRVVGDAAGVQCFEEGGLGDQRLAGAGRGADQHALLRREPGQQGFFLHRVGRIRELVEVGGGQFVAGGLLMVGL